MHTRAPQRINTDRGEILIHTSLFPVFYFSLFQRVPLAMANQISKPTSPWSQVMHIAERVLTDRRLIVLKNIVFILVLLNYWSYFYSKFAVGGPVRAFKDLQLYVKRVCWHHHFLLHSHVY